MYYYTVNGIIDNTICMIYLYRKGNIMKTTQEAAEHLGISPRRVRALIKEGLLKAERVGRDWLVDEASLEERLSKGRGAAGRPPKGTGSDETRFTLKNRTHDIVSLVYDASLREFTSIGGTIDASRAPLGLVDRRGRVSLAACNSWWRGRGIPAGRSPLAKKLLDTEAALPFELAVKNLGLSLSDQYWICPEESELNWHELNLFDNSFDEPLANETIEDAFALYHPDNTSDGALPKHWVLQRGERRLLKGGRELAQEPYNEVVATALCKRLLDASSYVVYELDSFEGTTVSSCPLFLTSDEEFIPAHYVLRSQTQPNHHNEYQHYLECCHTLGVPGAELALAQMIVIDDILANTDRHFRNFGIIRNVETLVCRPAPLFDMGTSLWCNQPLETLLRGSYDFASKPFRAEPAKQLLLVSDLSWIKTEALDGFVEEAAWILSQSELLTERLSLIKTGLSERVERMCAIRRYL